MDVRRGNQWPALVTSPGTEVIKRLNAPSSGQY